MRTSQRLEEEIHEAAKNLTKEHEWRPSDRSPSSVLFEKRRNVMALVRAYGDDRALEGPRR